MRSNSNIEMISLFEMVLFALFFSPLPLRKGVEHDLKINPLGIGSNNYFSLVKSSGDVQRDVVSAEIGRFVVKIDGKAKDF